MSDAELRLLDKGLLFIPTIRTFPIQEIIDARDTIVRNIKLKAYFANDDDDDGGDFIRNKFESPSTWQPRNSQLDKNILDTISAINISTHKLLQSLPGTDGGSMLLPGRSNLTKDETAALRRLKDNRNIVIKSADKGGAIVVLDRDAYISEAYRQLNNTKYYRKLDRPIYTDNIAKINSILDRMLDRNFITKKQLAYLSADQETTRPRIFYLLPKIHKKAETWPQPGRMPEGRPIVSDCSSESNRISEYIDYYISPLACRHPAYLKDTYDFVGRIRGRPVGEGSLIVTGDVSSLYTNMNLDRIIAVIRETFISNPDASRPSDDIIELLDLTLRNNDFEFNSEYYLQIHGTAMGKRYAPSLANLYLVYFDEMARTGFRIQPEFYFRFLDDIIFVWNGSREDLMEYQTFLNGLIPDINVSLSCHSEQIDFLDTTVYKNYSPSVTTLQTRVFFKPTDTHQLLHTESFHPKHTTTGILKSQLLRFKRISSTHEDYGAACYTLFQAIQKRGYSRSRLRKMKREIWADNQTLGRNQIAAGRTKMIPLILRYNQFAQKFMTLWKTIINENSTFKDCRLVAAYRKNKNLGNFLTRSKLQNNDSNTTAPNAQQRTHVSVGSENSLGFQQCQSARCYACKLHCSSSASFDSSTRNCSHIIKDSMSCRSANIVYLITCRKCRIQYVGETSRTLAERLTDHRSNIKHRKNTPIAIHFNSANHSAADLRAVAIEQIRDSERTLTVRRQREQYWQNKLGTKHPQGLNEMPVE